MKKYIYMFVCLFVCFCGRPLSKELGIPIGILPTSGAGVDGNAPYQAQDPEDGVDADLKSSSDHTSKIRVIAGMFS